MSLPRIILLYLLLVPLAAIANGDADHSHGDVPANAAAGASQPRVEAATETFELVGQLQGKALTLLVDRFETNEPVLDGNIEVEVKAVKAAAKFRPEQGDYIVTETALINALLTPGEHALVFTVSAGNDSDLLEGTMHVAEPAHHAPANDSQPNTLRTSTLLVVLAAVLLAIGAAWVIRRGNSTGGSL